MTDQYSYDAFGRTMSQTGSTSNQYLFTGEPFDRDLGLYYLRSRYVSPESGRFLSADTYEGRRDRPQTQQKYAYAEGDPVNGTDPTGHGKLLELLYAATGLLILATNTPTFHRMMAAVNVGSFLLDPAGYVQSFQAAGSNPSELIDSFAASMGKLAKSVRPVPQTLPNLEEVRGGVVTLKYAVGDIRDFWYKAQRLQAAAREGK